MSTERVNNYDPQNVFAMEQIYGEGFMSPGGAEEVARIIAGTPPAGGRILDLGCGLGGASVALARHFPTSRVTGLDIAPPVIERARVLVTGSEVAGRIDLALTEPGPLPFDDATFDLVYANSTTCHIEDLPAFFRDIRRVLKPAGVFLGAEWFVGERRNVFEVWDDLLRERGLNFYFVERGVFSAAVEEAGFDPVRFRDRSQSMSVLAVEGLARAEDSLRRPLTDTLGETGYRSFLGWTRARAAVLNDGGMTHCHFRAASPK